MCVCVICNLYLQETANIQSTRKSKTGHGSAIEAGKQEPSLSRLPKHLRHPRRERRMAESNRGLMQFAPHQNCF